MVLSPCLSLPMKEWKWPMVWSPWKTVFWVLGTLITSTHSRQPVSWRSFSACPPGLIKFNHFMETTGKNREWGPKRCVNVLRAPAFLSTSLVLQFPHLSTGGKRVAALLVSYTLLGGTDEEMDIKAAESEKSWECKATLLSVILSRCFYPLS